ncbi:unnamed protein product [Calicophoron daubneyi]|uniref:Uncharacterized protein n=1 Tax=Calicophoron daubneyi TaxID=300641 RepID=A0AAV2TE16_CALDB
MGYGSQAFTHITNDFHFPSCFLCICSFSPHLSFPMVQYPLCRLPPSDHLAFTSKFLVYFILPVVHNSQLHFMIYRLPHLPHFFRPILNCSSVHHCLFVNPII